MGKKLELNRETVRELTEADLQQVGGGQEITKTVTGMNTQTPVCPSGATWFQECGSYQVTCS